MKCRLGWIHTFALRYARKLNKLSKTVGFCGWADPAVILAKWLTITTVLSTYGSVSGLAGDEKYMDSHTSMQIDINVHCYIDEYFTVEWYRCVYTEPIYPIPNSDMSSDDTCELRMRPSIAKKRPGRPRKKRIES